MRLVMVLMLILLKMLQQTASVPCTDQIIFSFLPPEQDHVEGYLELSAKTKSYFATAVTMWDAEYYVKVDDDVHVNIGT